MDPDRCARAAEAISDGRAPTPGLEPGEYRVPSFTTPEQTYTVRLDGRECDCPDSLYRGATCKHVYLVALTRGLSGE